jgi:hypothetical protein
MATWDINYWPWGGVTICFDEAETKTLEYSASPIQASVGFLALAPPPAQVAAAVIGAFFALFDSIVVGVDQGNGVCFSLSWAAVSLGQVWAVIPSAAPPPPPPPPNNQQHVNYVAPSQYSNIPGLIVQELWYSDSGGWQHNPLNQLAGATDYPAAPGSPLDGYATTFNRQQHVNYIGTDGLIHELWYSDSGGWQHNSLTQLAGAPQPSADSPLDGYQTAFNRQQHVNFIALSQDSDVPELHVYELWYSDSGGWRHNDLTQLAGATDYSVAPWTLSGYATEFNRQQHVIFLDFDGYVHELWYSDSGGWQHNPLTQLADATAYPGAVPQVIGGGPGSLIHGYVTEFNRQQHVNYFDSQGGVHELWYSDSGGWQHNPLTQLAAAPPAAPGSPLDGYATEFNSQQHVNYVGTDGDIHELWYSDSGGWQHNPLTQLAGAPQPSADSPLDGYATEFNSQQHVNFIAPSQESDVPGLHVYELWYSDSGGWRHNDLIRLAAATEYSAVPGSHLDGYVT